MSARKQFVRNIALLSLLIVTGGAYAFYAYTHYNGVSLITPLQSFAGGRVHDYYYRGSAPPISRSATIIPSNKDVFVENYSIEPILVRVKLKEFLSRDGNSVVSDGGLRENPDSWTTWRPEEENINQRATKGTELNNLTAWKLGAPEGEPPKYLPTFNHDPEDKRTAAAGHARDWIQSGHNNTTIPYNNHGATHPGNGTARYWDDEANYHSDIHWPGMEEWEVGTLFDTKQVLREERQPMTVKQWANLSDDARLGNFWVVDHVSGWAYWANKLNPDEATSYLLDNADLSSQGKRMSGTWYYGIHVIGDYDSLELNNAAQDPFFTGNEQHHPLAKHLVSFIRNSI